MQWYACYVDLFGASRLKELILTARLLRSGSARGRLRPRDRRGRSDRGPRAPAAATITSHAPITLWVTQEAVRRIQEARLVPNGDDLIARTYGSADFKEGVRAFVNKRPPRWTGS